MFTRAEDASGNDWSSPVALYTGSSGAFLTDHLLFPVLKEVGGLPSVAFSNADSNQLFMQGSNADGSAAWAAPLDLLNPGSAYALLDIGGNPAIGGYHHTLGVQLFKGTSSDGTSWAMPESVTAAPAWDHNEPPASFERHLALAGLSASLCAAFPFGETLGLVESADAAATIWSQPYAVASVGKPGSCARILELGGKAALLFRDEVDDGIYIIRQR
jgi:hypothetical protein